MADDSYASISFLDEGPSHRPWQRHLAWRADDRLHLRGVPIDRPARSPHAAVGLSRRRGRPSILIDTSTDLRMQALTQGVTKVDAILFTHSHADHIMGMDEVAPLQRREGRRSLLRRRAHGGRSAADVLLRLRSAEGEGRRHAAGRALDGRRASTSTASASSRCRSMHGSRPILGFRLAPSRISPTAIGSPTRRGRYSKVSTPDSRCAAPSRRIPRTSPSPRRWRRSSGIKPRQTYFTHICHDLPHAETNKALPAGVELAYDGLAFDIEAAPASPNPIGGRNPLSRGSAAGVWRSPVLALGNFDGLHRGHVKIIERIQRGAAERGGTQRGADLRSAPAAHPASRQGAGAADDQGAEARRAGARRRAGRGGGALHARDVAVGAGAFVRTVLVEWLRVAEVWVGADFLFGRDRSGNFTLLRSLGAQYGFRAEKIDPIRYKDFIVSSTRIRRLVSEGRVDEAGALLGHHYAIDGTVVEGAKRGREMGFPTANLSTDERADPAARRLCHRR